MLFNNTTEQGNFPAVNGASANDVAFDNATNELFLTDPTQNVVSVFSTVSDELVATVPVADPQGVAYDPGTGQAFVTSSVPYPGSGSVAVISAATDRVVAQAEVGVGPIGIAYDARMGEMFVANSYSNNVSVLNDTSDSVVASVTTNETPETLAFDNTTGDLFVEYRVGAMAER